MKPKTINCNRNEKAKNRAQRMSLWLVVVGGYALGLHTHTCARGGDRVTKASLVIT